MTDYESRDLRIALTGTQFSWKKLVYYQSLAVSGGNKVDKVSNQLEAKLLLATASSSRIAKRKTTLAGDGCDCRDKNDSSVRVQGILGCLAGWQKCCRIAGSTFLREIVPWRKLHQKRGAIRTCNLYQ